MHIIAMYFIRFTSKIRAFIFYAALHPPLALLCPSLISLKYSHTRITLSMFICKKDRESKRHKNKNGNDMKRIIKEIN